MLNYLKSECYRTFHRKYLYVFVGICALTALGVCVLFGAGDTQGLPAEIVLSIVIAYLPVLGQFALLLMANLAFSGEHKHGTLKNTVSFGVSREIIYFGKLLTAWLYSAIVLAAVIGAFWGFGILLPGIESVYEFQKTMETLGWMLLEALPLWTAALSLAVMLMFLIPSEVGAIFCYLGLMTCTGIVLSILNTAGYSIFGEIREFLISTQLGNIPGTIGDWNQMMRCWISGLAYTAVFCLIGCGFFRKIEVR